MGPLLGILADRPRIAQTFASPYNRASGQAGKQAGGQAATAPSLKLSKSRQAGNQAGRQAGPALREKNATSDQTSSKKHAGRTPKFSLQLTKQIWETTWASSGENFRHKWPNELGDRPGDETQSWLYKYVQQNDQRPMAIAQHKLFEIKYKNTAVETVQGMQV